MSSNLFVAFFARAAKALLARGVQAARRGGGAPLLFAGLLLLLAAAPLSAHAAIIEEAPPIDAFFESNTTVGGGAILPLVQFRLNQTSGNDTLTTVGVQIVSTTTVNNLTTGEVARLSLWKESGAHPGFQIDEDTFLAGAAAANPATSTLILLQPQGGATVSGSVQFYIVASTTAASGLVNSHALNAVLQANYASTSASTGVGTAFSSNKKATLNQTATLKISEVKAGSTGNTSDEFVELYNTGEADINLSDLPLSVHSFFANGSSTPGVSLTYYRKVIPSHGYFLIANQTGYGGAGVPPDAVFATSTFNIILQNGGVSIATSTLGTAATSTAIDYLGWGTQPIGNCENAEASSTPCAFALPEDGTSLERLATGYPSATSTAVSLAAGGVDAAKGNGFDKNFNKTDFVLQSVANPQNSFSPREFPFGGGGSDTSKLQVQGSFPSSNQTGVPIDIRYVGFNFNKSVATTTVISPIATSTVTLYKVVGSAPVTTTNYCASVSYNPFPSTFEPQAKCNLIPLAPGSSATLEAATSYVFTVTSGVLDLSGNALDQDSFQSGNQNYAATSTTGSSSQTSTNVTPPMVVGVSPFRGSQNVPTNIVTVSIEFNQASMDTSTFTNNITLSGGLSLSGFSFSTSTGKNILTASVGGTPTVNTAYTLTVGTGVKTAAPAGIPLAMPYISMFTTGGSADVTAPSIVGTLPANNTTITANTNDFVFTFDDNIDGTTATSGAVTLAITGGANLPGAVFYNPVAKEGHFNPTNVLPIGQSLTLTLKGASIRNISNQRLGSDVTRTYTVETPNSDTTPPSLLFANADDFSVAISFNEAVNSTDATTLGNYTLSVGGVSQTLSALAGHQLSYDAPTRTVKLTGLRIPGGSSFTVTAQNIKDISGNQMTSASSVSGTAQAFASSGGFVGPGSFSGSTFGAKMDFSSAGIGFMPPVSIRPSSTFVSASSTYAFELPLSKQINDGGSVVITFPSSSDFGLCCVATTSARNPFLSTLNADINGPSDGTIGVNTIVANSLAKTVTLTLKATGSGITGTRKSGTDEHDFLKFSLADLVNPSIPKGMDSSGYTLDIKSKKVDGTLLESFSANPVYIGGGSLGGGQTTSISGVVSGNGGNLQGVLVHLMAPSTGPMDATTDSNGLYQFGNIPVGSQFLTNNFGGGSEFMLFTEPFINPTGTSTAFFGSTMPTPLQATSTSLLTRNFALTATSSAINFDVRLSASASTFTATEQLDVFAGGPGQFVVRTVTPGVAAYGNTVLTTVPLPQSNGSWGIGIGPAMPRTGGGFSGPPPAPNWSMPKPVQITVSGCPSACVATQSGSATTSNVFTITTADKTISGVVKDGSGNAVAGAIVTAFSAVNGTGSATQTSTSGTFSLKVTTGSYAVSAFSPGVGRSRETPVVVDSSGNVFVNGSATASTGSSGANPFTLKMSKASYTITGQVTDGTNPVGNAPVFAYRTDAPGHIDASTDSSTGNYTLYVDGTATSPATWKVNSFIPGFGPMTEQTVTIAGANQSNVNFAPSSSQSFSIYSGNIYEDLDSNNIFATSTEGITGAVIRLSNGTSVNEGVSGQNGAFSIRVPSGTGYTIRDIFSPSYGRIAPLNSAGVAIGTFTLTASSTNQYIRVPVRNTVVVNIKDSNGNAVNVSKAFIDLYDTSTGLNNHVELTNATTTSLSFASSTAPKIRAFVQGVPPANISIASDSSQTSVSNSAVTIDNGTETVRVVVDTSTAAFSTINGTVYKDSATGGNELDNAWIQFVDSTNGVQFGTQATSSGTYLIKAANGTYQVLASKPGYIATPVTITVSGTTTQNFTLSSASLTISGTVTAGGAAASNAFVRAEKIGGGQAITQTDTSGAYSLSVTAGVWKVFATAEGYSEGASNSNPITVSGSSVTGQDVALTTTSSVSSTLATSNTFTDTSAGSFSNSTVNVKVDLDSNSLGASGNSSYLTAQETSNYPHTSSVNLVGGKAKDFNAYSGGSQVKNMQSGKTANVELTYTKTELNNAGITTTSAVSKLTVVSYSDDKKDWETVSAVVTYKDSSGNALASPSSDLSNVSSVSFSAVGSHFSDYALSSPTGVTPPDTPTGLTATAGAGAGSAIALSWGSSSSADGYYLYRDTNSAGSFPRLVDTTSTSYSDSAVTAAVTYYYKVAAYKSGGASESAASTAASATVRSAGGGGSPGGGGGGGGYGPAPRAQKIYPDGTIVYLDDPQAAAKMKELDAKFLVAAGQKAAAQAAIGAKTVPAAERAQAAAAARAVSPVFNKNLSRGAKGDDVKRLQALLGVEQSGRFGPATEQALKVFQRSHGIISSERAAGAGKLGPSTRAKLLEVFGAQTGATKAPAAAPAGAVEKPAAGAPVILRGVGVGSRGADVKKLQAFLGIEPTGFFGSLTQKAVQDFQKKYGIAKEGEPGYGEVGPATRAKLRAMAQGEGEVSAPESSAAGASSSGESGKSKTARQLEDAMKQLEALQALLKKAQ